MVNNNPNHNMIENLIKELTDAVKELTAAIRSGVPNTTANVTSETPKETPKKEPKAEKPKVDERPKKEDKPKTEEGKDLKAVQTLGMKLIKSGKQEAVKAVLKTVGAATFTGIKPESLATVFDGLTAVDAQGDAPPAEEPAKEKSPAIKLEDVLPIAKRVTEAGDEAVAELKALLAKYKSPKVSQVPADKLAAFTAELKAILPTEDESLV